MGKPGQILGSKCSVRYYCKIALDLLFSKIIDYQKNYKKLSKTSIFFKEKGYINYCRQITFLNSRHLQLSLYRLFI